MKNEKLKSGQEITLPISDLAFGGKGISKNNSLIFFVKDAIPNQTVIAKISKIKKKYIEAYKIQTLKKSKNEVEAKCEHFDWCGGCTVQQLDYKKQLYYKQKQIFNILQKIGKVKNLNINTIIGCDKIFYYRNKMEYTFSGNPWYIDDESYDEIILGLHVPKRFDKILNIDKCHINNKIFNDILLLSKKVAVKYKLIPYDVVKHQGFLRFLVLRAGFHTNEIMVNIVTSCYNPKLLRPFIQSIKNNIPHIKSIVNTVNTKKKNTASGSIKLLYGQKFIFEKIGTYKFKISPNSFFQTNSYQVKILYDYILKTAKLKKSDVVYDLYCGTGTIGIYLSKLVKKVYGIDIVDDAIKDAKYNAKLNNITNIDFFCMDLKNILNDNYTKKLEQPNVVIIDPPRPGLHQKALNSLIELLPKKIIYVSCNPATMARDIDALSNHKYKVVDIQPIDMFLHTPHIECITTLNIN